MGYNDAEDRKPYGYLFALNLVVMTGVVCFMCYALYKIRKTVQEIPRMNKKVNMPRMIAHSLAYIIYLVAYFAYRIVISLNSDGATEFLYSSWFILTIVAAIQFYLFFRILWHLGTKEVPLLVSKDKQIEENL